MELVLSTFTGAGLLDLGFSREGFAVVSLGDLITNRDIRLEHVPAGHFDGVIGGPPCPDFSKARRSAPIKPYACDIAGRVTFGYGVAMLREFVRIVTEAQPKWWLMENVPGVPDVTVPGFVTQRIEINSREVGSPQSRWRSMQWGSRDGVRLVIPRCVTEPGQLQPTVLASEFGSQNSGRSLPEMCELQGLPRNFTIPGQSRRAIAQAVGNGVPVQLGRALAAAIRDREARRWTEACRCGCGRPVARAVTGGAEYTLATDACRQRVSREQRDASASQPRMVTPELLAV